MFHKSILATAMLAGPLLFRMPVSDTGGAATAEDTGESSGETGTGTGTGTESAASTETGKATKKAAKPEVKSDPVLGGLINTYEDAADKATSFYVEMIDYIRKQSITRAVLVKTLMEFRKVTADTAVTQASRILTMSKNDEVLNALQAGEITLKVARQQVTKTREPKAAGSGSAGTAEQKQTDFDNKLKAFAGAAKALGYDLKSILATVKATLQAEPFSIK